jgi:hypothetical protein
VALWMVRNSNRGGFRLYRIDRIDQPCHAWREFRLTLVKPRIAFKPQTAKQPHLPQSVLHTS